jgi:hypothetical protein
LHFEQQKNQRFSKAEKERHRTAATGDTVANKAFIALAACGTIAAKKLRRLTKREVPGKAAAKSDVQY